MSDPVTPIAMIGLSALGTANSISQANASKKLSQARTRLQLAQAKRDEAEQLAQGLARQNVVAGARGVSASTGSQMRQALAASRLSARNVALASAGAAAANAESSLRARNATTQSLLSFGETLAKRGPGLVKNLLEERAAGRGDPNGLPRSF